MFKLIVLSAVLAVAAARPGLLGLGATSIVEPVSIGSVVRSIPTAISHSSQTQVHSSPIVTPILSQVVKTIAAPTIIRSAPILTAAAPTIIRSEPILTAAAAPTIIKSAPILTAAAAPTIIRSAPILSSASLLPVGGQIISAGSPLLSSDLGLGLGLKLH